MLVEGFEARERLPAVEPSPSRRDAAAELQDSDRPRSTSSVRPVAVSDADPSDAAERRPLRPSRRAARREPARRSSLPGALARRHHPDVAGPEALELAKRINVAHDWLSDPDLRRRYDRERSSGVRAGRPPRAGADWAPRRRRPVRRPPTTAELVASVVERVGRLTATSSIGSPSPSLPRSPSWPPLRQFVPPELERQLDAGRARRTRRPAAGRASDRPDPRRGRRTARRHPARRHARRDPRRSGVDLGARASHPGWDSAVGQPRYGPATRRPSRRCWSACRALDRRRPASARRDRHARAARGRRRGPPRRRPRRTMPCASRASSRPATPSPPSMPRSSGRGRRASERSRLPDARPRGSPTCWSCGTRSRRRAFERHAAPWLGGLIERPARVDDRPAAPLTRPARTASVCDARRRGSAPSSSRSCWP